MTFRFVCAKCGKVLFEDSSPQLKSRGNYQFRETYMEQVLSLIGKRCECGHRFQIPPIQIEVYPIKKEKK